MSVLLVGGIAWLACSLAAVAGVAYAGRRPWPDLDPDDCRQVDWDAHCADALGIGETPCWVTSVHFDLWEAEVMR